MANKNFVVKNGLTVGNLSIAADSGNITTTGSLSSASVYTNGLFYANGTPYATNGYTGSQGVGFTGSQGQTGLGFRIAKSYANVAALSADTTPTGIVSGEFAIVETGNVELPDNSKLYLWNGSTYSYVTDLSGAAGLTGPQGTTGYVGSRGNTGFTGSAGTIGIDGYTGSRGNVGYSGSTGLASGTSFEYQFITSTADSDPGVGNIKVLGPSVPTTYSILLDGNGDYVTSTLNSSTSNLFAFTSTENFTIEMWFKQVGDSIGSPDNAGSREAVLLSVTQQLQSFPLTGWSIGLDQTSTSIGFSNNNNENSGTSYSVSVSVTRNVWHHFAVTRDNGTLRLFLDGTLLGSSAAFNNRAITVANDSYLRIGAFRFRGYYNDFNGYINNVRLVKGTALYTSGFSVPTNSFTAVSGTNLLAAQNNTFIDNSVNNISLTAVGNATTSTENPLNQSIVSLTTANQIIIDHQTVSTNNIYDFLKTIDDSTSAVKGHITLTKKTDTTKFSLYSISGLTELSGYVRANISYIAGTISTLDALDTVILSFNRTGDKGDTGFTGSQGIIGYTGSTGSIGYSGSQGTTGFVGSQGTTGYVGSAGTIGVDGYTGSVGYAGSIGYTGSKGDTGLGFLIAKTYVSVAALTADTSPTGIIAGQFAIIETGNVNDAENSRLYLWNGSVYSYVNDLSGAAGIKGDLGYTGSQGLVGYVGSMGYVTNWLTKTANYTAQNGDRLIANTASGTFTITLPATPSVGHFVEIADGNNFFTNPLYVDRNGSTIESQSSDLEINITAVGVQFLYDGSTWQIITNAGITGNIGYTGSKGNPGGNGYSIISVNTNTTLTANTKTIVDTSTANITLTLPTTAGFGDEVFVIDGTGNASTHAITIARNGHKIQGLSEDMIVSSDRAAFGLTYYNSTHGWLLNNV